MSEPSCFRFGEFILDIKRHRLFRAGEDLQLPGRAMTVLETLVVRAPETVDKTDLLDVAWSDVAVIEDNLVQAIGAIRTVLEDNPRDPAYVQTVHRRGYRFIAPLEPIVAAAPTQRITLPDPPALRSRPVLRLGWIAAATGLLATIVAGSLVLRTTRDDGRVRALAVLPMTDLSASSPDDFFADGMTDALITELARYPELQVISRTSVIQYRDTQLTVPQIARELGVDALVEGTVTRTAGRVRVIAQLVDAGDHHIWGESFERPLEDVLGLQRDIAEAIAGEIGARLQLHPSHVPARPAIDPEAHTAYLRGRHVAEERTRASLDQAVQLFEEAIRLEPAWAQPWLGLADTTNLMANYGYVPSNQARPRARQAALEALQLEPNLAEAFTALALVEAEFDWDFSAAEADFRRALDLNPSSATSHSWYANFLVSQGRVDEAVREIQKAHRLDPLSSIIEANIGWFHLLAGNVEVAEQRLRRTLVFDPDFVVAHYYLGILLACQGRAGEGVKELESAVELSDGADFARAALAFALAKRGDVPAAADIRDVLIAESEHRYVSPVSLTYAAIAIGDADGAFSALEAVFEERKGWLLHLRFDPLLAGIRADPRFEDLATRVGLP